MKRTFEEIVPPWIMATMAMFSVQLGSALSMPLIKSVGAGGTAWLRLSMGALIFIAIGRPSIRKIKKQDYPTLISLGVATGMFTVLFLASIERIPLGTTVAIEFLGPLTVAAVQSHKKQQLVWPGLALIGVILLTQPWIGDVDALGIFFAACAAVGWGIYIVLTQKIGDKFSGVTGLALTIPIAALTAGVIGVPQASGNITVNILIAALGLAILLPVIPYALEMTALRHMTPNAFGTFMALEPAMGAVLGLILLNQVPAPNQVLGIGLVVFAGAAAQKGGRRQHDDEYFMG